ncbi:MAG: hemerythrin domain-containing protein [Chloroherpetonaceae bacterium]|nr:hemerythrin domain-containing protein [Chthonomonadaceae bacterium]MDW8208212.1 hemerythrin domain-containing protein [Chloroherpetonaceae bacterium]
MGDAAIPTVSFMALKNDHDVLQEQFLQHQEALLAQDLPLALQVLHDYIERLHQHMQAEEDILLPVYRRAGPVMGGDEELFRAEHRKIRALLQHFVERVEAIQRAPENLRRQVLSLLDEQAAYKNLLLHHELREHNLLFPALDRVTQEAERIELLRQSRLS